MLLFRQGEYWRQCALICAEKLELYCLQFVHMFLCTASAVFLGGNSGHCREEVQWLSKMPKRHCTNDSSADVYKWQLQTQIHLKMICTPIS